MTSLCCILSYDYLDYDIFLNVRVFYRSAGYHLCSDTHRSRAQLLVILRGIPTQVDSDFSGTIHIYDYVQQYDVDYRQYFPNATQILCITLDTTHPYSIFDKVIFGYVPVYPTIWASSRSLPRKSSKPLHIANYKPIGTDPYQEQLINLIQSNEVLVYGAKWDRIGIHTKPLSYWSANNLLSRAIFCFGLMYPYQRGSSLSGRMWQAPINGCHVISEIGTNVFACPGVIEYSDYRLALHLGLPSPACLATEAIDFWTNKTIKLADELGLSQDKKIIIQEIFFAKLSLLLNHLSFQCSHHVLRKLDFILPYTRRIVKAGLSIFQ